MTFFELFLIGIGLSMDAFAVSICKGLSMQKIDKKYTLCIGLFFGGFQALMPLTGYLLGSRFSGYIERFDHWIAFVLLALIGFNMIKESREEEEEEEKTEEDTVQCREKWDLSGDIIDCFQRYSSELSAEEQEEIIKGIEEGLTDQEVKRYFRLYGADKMQQYRRVLTARKNRT